LRQGLLDVKHLPAGDGATSEDTASPYEFDVFGSDLCRGGTTPDMMWDITNVGRTFRYRDGPTLTVSIAAVGASRARTIVGYVAAAPTRCPSVTQYGLVTKYFPLPIPDLGGPAAGLISVGGDDKQPTQGILSVAVAYGDVSVVFQQHGGASKAPDRFLTFVSAGAKKALRRFGIKQSRN